MAYLFSCMLWLILVVISGCQTFGSHGSRSRLSEKKDLLVSEVLSPNMLYIGDGDKYRKVRLAGVSPVDEDHEDYDRILKSLRIFNGRSVTIRYSDADFWKRGDLPVFVYYDRIFDLLPETGKEIIDEGVLLNAYMLEHGFGRYNPKDGGVPTEIRNELVKAEKAAKDAGRGVWQRAKLP